MRLRRKQDEELDAGAVNWVRKAREHIRKHAGVGLPALWQRSGCLPIGGLIGVGFAEDRDLLLVLSVDGRGVIDCATGSKVARDRSPDCSGDAGWHHESRLKAVGIGPLADVTVRVAGLHGGGLPTCTEDGWRVESFVFDPCDPDLVLVPPGATFWAPNAPLTRLAAGAGELRAFGFSYTGKSLVIATSADVTIFYRSACS